MSDSPIGVGIAGLGFGEKVHLPAISTHPILKPIALWHPRDERLQKSVQQHDLTGYTSWDELLNDPKIDAVIIATPPEPRFELARRALEAGKHLLLEKPVALRANDVAELQRIALQQQLSVAVDFEYRAVPLFMQAARLLAEGAVGTPWLVKLDWLMSSRADASRPWNWYSQRRCGGGVLGALGTHAFDMLAWLIGPINSIQAVNHVSIKERPHPSGTMATVDAEDVSLIQTTLNWQGQCDHLIPAQISLSSVARNGRGCWIEVYGSDVDYINAHGTSTPVGDLAELSAIKKVFGKNSPIIGSTKSMTGHSLGATGAQEAIYSILMMQNDFIAPSINIDTLVEEAEDLHICQSMMEQELNSVMSNSFGFGGTNASLIFCK